VAETKGGQEMPRPVEARRWHGQQGGGGALGSDPLAEGGNR